MSSEELSNFIFAAEHSHSLRKELKECLSDEMIINLASKYGFALSISDLRSNPISERIDSWFSKSTISPIKK